MPDDSPTAPEVSPAAPTTPGHGISFRAALKVWLKIATNSFGGPAGQIAVMHRVLVEEKRWIGESRFLHALNYCMLLPGPEAQQLVTYMGWLLHRTAGGLAAGALFVLPGFLSILALSLVYTGCQDVKAVEALFYGLKPAVLAVVLEAVLRIGRRALKNRVRWLLAGAAFIAIFFADIPFPFIVVGAGMIGLLDGRLWRASFFGPAEAKAVAGEAGVIDRWLDAAHPEHTRPSFLRAVRVAGVCLSLWFIPLLLLGIALGSANVFVQEGIFFSKTAVVTFGGAYSVLAYIAQQAVDVYGWLRPGEMLDGLGMAETTPGPLIQVVQFVGYLGAWRQPGALPPWLAGVLASILVTWVTYVPCFLWIFLGAPYIEALRSQRALGAALAAITAAVVGVILNLAVWFSLHALFARVEEQHRYGLRLIVPDVHSLDPVSLILAAAAILAMLRFKTGMLVTLGASAVAGLIWRLGAG